MSEAENTPIDRPLMRSDLNDVRQAVHALSETVLGGYYTRRESRLLTVACLVCTIVSIGCAITSLSARDTVVRAASAAQVAP